jgi:transcriptional regulator with XRE-family HTH domain
MMTSSRNLDQIIAGLPPERQARIDTSYRELKQEVEGLRALRRLAGKAQRDIATALKIKQPSVSKIEKQADMYLSTLRSYIEAIGGELDLIVRLPEQPAFRLRHLGDVFEKAAEAPPTLPRAASARLKRAFAEHKRRVVR